MIKTAFTVFYKNEWQKEENKVIGCGPWLPIVDLKVKGYVSLYSLLWVKVFGQILGHVFWFYSFVSKSKYVLA